MSAHHEGEKKYLGNAKMEGEGGGGPMLYCPLQGKLSLVRHWKEE